MEPYPPVSVSKGVVSSYVHHPNDMTDSPASCVLASSADAAADSSSDAEVAQIDFHSSKISLRHKLKKVVVGEVPRPMSWEGELSDGEKEMCIDEDSESQLPENLSFIHSKEPPSLSESKGSPILQLKQSSTTTYSLHSTPSNSPLLNQRHLNNISISCTKEIMQKALNIPPTPSPDSAIHSTYSVFSSPSQSPLAQRHLTPNLSRNNSDASHSSCCSYSSVSVSVSPTQQFSPAHSPVQVKNTITFN